MDDFVDPEVVDVSFPDEDIITGSLDFSDFHTSLFEAACKATREQYFEDPFDDSDVTNWSHESATFCRRIEVNGATAHNLEKCMASRESSTHCLFYCHHTLQH
jgi:hypothetical protein